MEILYHYESLNSLKNKNKNKNYKISHEKIKQISTSRLKKHIDKVKEIKRDFLGDKEEYVVIKQYVFFLNKELKERSDYEEVINNMEKKRVRSKLNKGCQHKKSFNKSKA